MSSTNLKQVYKTDSPCCFYLRE